MSGVTLLGGFSAGIALMYFLDPEQGKRRRALFRDQLNKWLRIGSRTAAGTARNLRNRSAGVLHDTRAAAAGLTGDAGADDETSVYAPTGYNEDVSIAQASPTSEPWQAPDQARPPEYGAGSAYNESKFGGSSDLDQSSDYDDGRNRDEQSRIEVS